MPVVVHLAVVQYRPDRDPDRLEKMQDLAVVVLDSPLLHQLAQRYRLLCRSKDVEKRGS